MATGNERSGREIQIPGGADGGFGEHLALGGAMGDFVADDGAEFGVGVFLADAVADAAEVEVGAVADVALVLVGPADKAVITVFRFHGLYLAAGACVFNRLFYLALLVGFRVVAFGSADGDDAREIGMLELAVGAFLPVDEEAGAVEIGEELADLAGHWGGISKKCQAYSRISFRKPLKMSRWTG